MAKGYRSVNTYPGTGNPVKIDDFAYIWEVIGILGLSIVGETKVVSGFDVTGSTIGEGIIFFNGSIYYLDNNKATLNQYLYAQTLPDDERVYEDGASHYMYNVNIVNVANTAIAEGIGTLIGQVTSAQLDTWKQSYVSQGLIKNENIADDANIALSKLDFTSIRSDFAGIYFFSFVFDATTSSVTPTNYINNYITNIPITTQSSGNTNNIKTSSININLPSGIGFIGLPIINVNSMNGDDQVPPEYITVIPNGTGCIIEVIKYQEGITIGGFNVVVMGIMRSTV